MEPKKGRVRRNYFRARKKHGLDKERAITLYRNLVSSDQYCKEKTAALRHHWALTGNAKILLDEFQIDKAYFKM